ncbi:SDR family oxidoreductase [Thermoflexus sp.]|uniref:SDR family oxidoreductase n=1 Tax=Thermoflexus sp. TaxID=1969742 RepID=UPI002617280A|nr:SDR family oxidoreductase [Thermoflexus sp.]MCX7691367.1 SDR family oxidoreductase [Thermoflexus sp.]
MRALITGGTGFLGANLAAYLRGQGWTVRILRRATSPLEAIKDLEVEHAIGDVLDPDSLRPAMVGCDVVFHTAAISAYWRTPAEQILRVNIEGTRNVLATAQELAIRRVVLTSSLAALGVPEPGTLLTEDHPYNLPPGRFLYGYSKAMAEAIARIFVEQGLEVVIVNPSVILGPRDIHRISGSLILEMARERVPALPPGGVNVVAVEDVARGHLLALERGRPGERYILGGENLSYRELAEQIAEIVGVPAPRRVLAPPVVKGLAALARIASGIGVSLPIGADQLWLSAHFIWCDGRKAEAELGYRPEIPVREAIRRAWEWYQTTDKALEAS